MDRPLRLLVVAPALALALACGTRQEAPPAPAPSTAEAPAPAATEPPPAALLPITSPSGSPSRGTALRFDLPAAWRGSEPTSNLRVAQATIPGPGGDGELAVFWFGEGQGGDVESNLARWAEQMNAAPGHRPERDTFEEHGLRVTWVDIPGTLAAGAMGNTAGTDRSGWRLYGAVVEGPGGPWFFKATGPEATLAGQRDAFLEMLHNAYVASPRPGI